MFTSPGFRKRSIALSPRSICLAIGIDKLRNDSIGYRRYASGLWRHDKMLGYTTTGVGVSGLPVRFNTRGEVVLITLRRSQASQAAPLDRPPNG